MPKLTQYALNPDSRRGRSKARVFRSALGLTRDDADTLACQIVERLPSSPVVSRRDSPYGATYQVDMPIVGRDGRSAMVVTAWKLNADGRPQLVTLRVDTGQRRG